MKKYLENSNIVIQLEEKDISTMDYYKTKYFFKDLIKNLEDIVQDYNLVLLDLKDINFIDSTGIGGILNLNNYLKNNNKNLKLTNIKLPIIKVFSILGIDKGFGIIM